MFRLIGIVVFGFVVMIGWSQIKNVYEGGMSGKEAITEIREKSANALRSKSEDHMAGQLTNSPQSAVPLAPAEKDAMSMANELLSK